MSLSERSKEIKRRRHRRKKLTKLRLKLHKGNPADRAPLAEKVRKLTPGAEDVINSWGLKDI